MEAMKLTCTNKNGLTVGILQSITGQTSSSIDSEKLITEPLTNYAIARLQKNWDGNTLLGGMMTSVNRNSTQKELTDILVKNAFTGGIDFTQYFSNRLYYIDAKARSEERRVGNV